MSAKPILVGQVAGAFGVKGEVKITAYTQDPMALSRFAVLLTEDGSPALTLQSARAAKGGVICRVKEIDTKEAADAARGRKLYVAREALPPVEDEDEFYLADLIGLIGRTPQGARLGVIKALHNFGAGDVVELDPGGGRSTVLYAFTRDIFPDVRPADGYVVVVPPLEDDGDAAGADRGLNPNLKA
jgi:16S rRNA processing protein RimM